jgi:hypothetical protein
LDFLLWIMRDHKQDFPARFDAAKAGAPYCHARLSSTEFRGLNKGPIETKEVTDDLRLEAFLSFAKKKRAENRAINERRAPIGHRALLSRPPVYAPIRGSAVTSGRAAAYRELDDALGLSALAW